MITDMDTKKFIKEIYQKVKTGQLTEVLQLIKGVEVITEVALNILICVSNGCYNNSKKSYPIEKDEVYDLLYSITSSIDALDESQIVPYLLSIFHIINYMCEKQWYDELTKMEFMIIPSFLNDYVLKNIEEGKRAYQAMIIKMCNSMFKLAERKTTTHNNSLLLLSKLILRANSQINGTKDTLSIAHKLLSILQDLRFRNDQLCEFYVIVLGFIKRDLEKNGNSIDGIQLLIHIFSNIISDIIKSKELEIAETFVANVDIQIRLSITQEEFLQSHFIFKAVTAVFPSSNKILHKMEKYREHIKDFNMGDKKILRSNIRFLEEPLYHLLSYYKSSGCQIWCDLPCETIVHILLFIRENICSELVVAPTKCSCGCSLEKNYCGTLKIGCQVSGLLKYYLDINKNVSKKYYDEIGRWQTYFYEILKKVKAHNCKKFGQIYRELGTYTYNIGTALYQQENEAFVDIYQCFLKYSIEFEGCSPELLKPSMNEVTINVICELELKSQNVERCMSLAALYCLLYPQKGNSVFQNWWIKSKLKVKEDSIIQQQTLVSILEEHRISLSSIVDPLKYLNKERKIELLSYELLRYKTVWKSKESIMAAFSHFILIADVSQIAQVILEIFGDGEIQQHENMPAVFSNATKRLHEFCKTNSDCYLKMALAVLNFYSYKNSAKETADRNLEEMEKTMQAIESTKENLDPIPKDPNDECDIVSAYSNLRLSKFLETLNQLNNCLELMTPFPSELNDRQIIKNIIKLLTKIGFEYRLHCFSIKCLQAFELSLKFAQIISDNAAQLLAISFLIENADTTSHFVKEMISQGDKIAELWEKDNLSDKHSKTLAIYQISKSKAFLYADENLSFESWKIADALVTANETKSEFKLIRAELYLLRYKLTKSCSFIAGEHERHPMTFKLHCAMDTVIALSHKNIRCSYELCILFDTVYELAKVYYLMRLPRDLRAYSKNSVLLTQKLVLPMRCVSFLILLAHSDLSTCKFDHCNVKLNGVNDIFCISQSRPILLSERSYFTETDTKMIENEVDSCASHIQETALDVPQHTRQYSPASPALVVESFKAPLFLSHKKSCMCFICLSFEYHQLLLQKYHLDAVYNMYVKDEKMAEGFINGALMLHQTLRQDNGSYRKKAKNLISESLIPNFDDIFTEYYGSILYDYSFHLIRKSQKSEALKVNTKLVELLKPKKLQYIYLYNDVLLQRLSYVIPEPKGPSIENETKMNNLCVIPNENTSIQRTPTSKKSAVTITISGVPSYSPQKRRVRKKCVLFPTSSDTEEAVKKSPTQLQKAVSPNNKTFKKSESISTFALPKTKEKKSAIPMVGTPFLGDPQTPKISIFTDGEPIGSIRKTRKKQPVVKKSVEIPEPTEFSNSVDCIKKSTKTVRKTLNSAMIFDENRYSSKEHCDQGNSQQLPIIAGPSKTRSQLLTEKIKASTCHCKTPSMSLGNNIVTGLLADKISMPINQENISPNPNESLTSSVISGSPEHEIVSTNSKATLEKLRLSAKKAVVKSKAGPEVKKNLLSDVKDSEAGSSKCIKNARATRKSVRNRVL